MQILILWKLVGHTFSPIFTGWPNFYDIGLCGCLIFDSYTLGVDCPSLHLNIMKTEENELLNNEW